MNKVLSIANILTLLRVLLSLVLFAVLLYAEKNNKFVYGLVIFLVASLTDFLDGFFARKICTTDFGKIFDPAADKILAFAALIPLISLEVFKGISVFYVFILLAREFIMAGVRQVLSRRAEIEGANIWGKMKTVFQTPAVVAAFVSCFAGEFHIWLIVSNLFLVISVIFSLISLIDFMFSNKENFKHIFEKSV
jgi:CDP-diacylglycerol--glycerol-3-phosphate 3-phosphatidyltransferase